MARMLAILVATAVLAAAGAADDPDAARAGGFEVAIGSGAVAPAGLAAVDLDVTAPEPGIGAATFDIAYDPAILRVHSCQTSWAGCNPAFRPDRLRVAGVPLSPPTGEVTVATITFEAIGSDGSQSALDLTVVDLWDASGADRSGGSAVTDGVVSVSDDAGPPFSPGDVDCDGEVTAADGLAVLSYVAGYGSPPCIELGDVNCDGEVDAADAVMILGAVASLAPAPSPCPALGA